MKPYQLDLDPDLAAFYESVARHSAATPHQVMLRALAYCRAACSDALLAAVLRDESRPADAAILRAVLYGWEPPDQAPPSSAEV